MDLNKKVEILCLVHKNNTEQMLNRLIRFYKVKLEQARKKLEKRLHRRLLDFARQYQEMLALHMQISLNTVSKRRPPKIWMKQRCRTWWNNIVNSNNFDEWVENFRVDKDTFKFLCDTLRPELKPDPEYVRKPLDVEIKVAIALYKLASCSEYRVIANQFGVHKASVYRSLKQFCMAVIKILLPEEIKMPNAEDTEIICRQFESKSGIPQIFGAIDGCHIPVKPPSDGYRDYINRKNWASIILQALVDANYRFLDITIKHPGCTHDAVVLKDSFLYANMNTYARPSKIVNGKEIKAFMVGDPAYPLQEWLMKGYVSPRNDEEESFNVYLNKARIVVENAFGRLKSRWRILQKKIDTDIKFGPPIIATCCVLHNLLEKRRVPLRESWMTFSAGSERQYPQPQCTTTSQGLSGNDIRDHLKMYMAENYPLITSRAFR